MRIPIAHMPPVIPVGVQTESGVEEIGVDVSPWLAKWPGMTVAVWLTRPGEMSAYPAGNVQMDGNVLIWRPDGYDTAIPGSGKMEILGLTQDGVKRKLTGDGVATLIRGTTLATTAEPGESEKPWVDKVLDAAQRAEDAADRAEGSAGGSVPIATKDRLGVIKVGDGLSITDDGVLSAQGGGSGTVTPEQVQEAVNEALQNAKESGEFDGPPGDPGVSATHKWDGTVLTMTSASGTSSADLKGDPGEPGVYIGTDEPTDPDVSVWIDPEGEGVELPEAYVLPAATEDTLGGVKVGKGLEVDADGTARVKPEQKWEFIESVPITGDGMQRITRTQTPDGQPYAYVSLMAKVQSTGHEEAIPFAVTADLTNGDTLYDYATNAIRKNYATIFRCFFGISKNGTVEIESIVSSLAAETVPSSNVRRYRRTEVDDTLRMVKIDIAATADIPAGTTIEIWGVRADA